VSSSTAVPAAPREHEEVQESPSLVERLGILAAVVLPLAGFVAAVVSLWGHGFGWADFALLGGMYLLTALGITVGFHRLFTHKSFETNAVVRFVLAALGSMAVQGSVLNWVAQHRRHHRYSDTPDDPHSPQHGGRGLLGRLRGFWHAHIGWAFAPDPAGLDRYVPDLRKLASVRVASALFPLWLVLGLAIPAAVGGILSGTWEGALFGLIWGGLVRVFLVHHVTWSVNSVCHLWGTRPYPEKDRSRKPEPEQRPVRHSGAGGGVAQQPPRLPHIRSPRAAVVAGRRQLLRHPPPRRRRARLEGPPARSDGPGERRVVPEGTPDPALVCKGHLPAEKLKGLPAPY
jgi:stearoyl-CoA desaturase (Delta-9 desaturase)